MKFILSIALIVAIVGFINAQSPPTSLQSCTTYVNSTAAAFCAPYVSYAIRNATDYGVVNTAAKTEFDSNIAKITNATDACRTALATYSCHNKISRCARNAVYTSVFQDTCSAVVSACGLNSTFPGTTFTGVACVANKLVTVEGNTAVCIPTQNVAVGASCRSPFTPDITTPTTVAYSSCPIVSSCNTTSTNPLCVVPSQVGDACSVASDCVNNPLSSGSNGVGSTFVCISNKCTYTNKRYQQSCFSNDECLSKNCTSGQCYEAPFGGYCTTSGGCRLNLYCDTKNSSCTQVALLNEPCGFVQANQDLLPCASGFTCVRGANGTASICRANANEGSACVPASGSIVQDGPLCNPISANGLITCQNNVCRAQSLGQTLGQGCNTTVSCSPQYTCSYTSTDFNAQGTCVNPGDVPCANVGGSACNTFQRCNCGADATQPGTCALDTTNPRVNCAAQQIKLAICQANTCNNAPFIAYEANACVTTQCKTELNSYYCCVKNTVGASFVAPTGMPSDPCATPSPTPGPTSPTSTGTGTPVPIQSSKRSSASAVAVNFIAVILAVVAFL